MISNFYHLFKKKKKIERGLLDVKHLLRYSVYIAKCTYFLLKFMQDLNYFFIPWFNPFNKSELKFNGFFYFI